MDPGQAGDDANETTRQGTTEEGVLSDHDPLLPYRFTVRQRQVLRLLGDGLKYRAIATRLGISERTVRVHAHAAADVVGYTHLPAQAALRQFMRELATKRTA